MSRLARLALVTTALTFLAVTAGGLVRATGSGLGCPSWPRCYGRWVPPLQAHAVIEMSHRYLVQLSGRGAGLAFHDWPLMGGRLLPRGLGRTAPSLQFAHRLAAIGAGVAVAIVAVRSRRATDPVARRLGLAAGGLFLAEAGVGGLNVF